LEDGWLERLNSLLAFQLISVCVGHVSGGADPHGTSPHIKIRLRESMLPGIATRWDESKLAVIDSVAQLFQTGDTYVNLELKMRLRASTGRLNYQEDLVARIHRRRPFVPPSGDHDRCAWFDATIRGVEALDRTIVALWEVEPPAPSES
jgi:hypothetical protein